jgi:branched-chain amino acid aminotransferase
VVPPTQAVPLECVDPRIKQRSRMHWWLAEQDARRIEPGSIALLRDAYGFVTETAAANILVVQGNRVISPPAACRLGGISLDVTIELCSALGFRFEERQLTVADCVSSDEAMLTSTPYGLVGIRSIAGTSLAWPGQITERLRHAWNEYVGLDLHQQILASP